MSFRLKIDSKPRVISTILVVFCAIRYSVLALDFIDLGLNDQYVLFYFLSSTIFAILIIVPFSIILINQFIIIKKDNLIICQGIRCFYRTIPVNLISSIESLSYGKYNICITYTGGAKKYLYVKKVEDLVIHLKNNYGEMIEFLSQKP